MILAFDPTRYPRAVTLLPQSEDDVQASILTELRRRGILAWHLDAGGRKTRRVLAARGVDMRAGGQGDIPAGWPDIFGVTPGGTALFIEVKRPGVRVGPKQIQRAGELSAEQKTFLETVAATGAIAFAAWDVSDVVAVLDGVAS